MVLRKGQRSGPEDIYFYNGKQNLLGNDIGITEGHDDYTYFRPLHNEIGGEWVPVSQQKPDYAQYVKSGHYITYLLNNGSVTSGSEEPPKSATHWLRLNFPPALKLEAIEFDLNREVWTAIPLPDGTVDLIAKGDGSKLNIDKPTFDVIENDWKIVTEGRNVAGDPPKWRSYAVQKPVSGDGNKKGQVMFMFNDGSVNVTDYNHTFSIAPVRWMRIPNPIEQPQGTEVKFPGMDAWSVDVCTAEGYHEDDSNKPMEAGDLLIGCQVMERSVIQRIIQVREKLLAATKI